MLSQSELLYYKILLIFSLCQSFAQEIFTVSFTEEVTGKSGTYECDFTIHFTDSEILENSNLGCGRIKKFMIIDFKYELKSSMHLLRHALKNLGLSLLIFGSNRSLRNANVCTCACFQVVFKFVFKRFSSSLQAVFKKYSSNLQVVFKLSTSSLQGILKSSSGCLQ